MFNYDMAEATALQKASEYHQLNYSNNIMNEITYVDKIYVNSCTDQALAHPYGNADSIICKLNLSNIIQELVNYLCYP